jgi:hypothetical protein
MSPDEGRAKIGYGPVPGGKYPYMQQQNFSLEALAKRDAQEDPFGGSQSSPPSDEEAKEQADTMELMLRGAIYAHQ